MEEPEVHEAPATMVATPPPPLPFTATRPTKTKVPARRVYGDDIEVEAQIGTAPDGSPITDVFHPHAGEWFDLVGSMTLDAYLESLAANRLRGKERELRDAIAKRRERANLGRELTDVEQAELAAAEADLFTIAEQIGLRMQKTLEQLAERVLRCAWTDSKGEAIGTPTGERDEQGNPICTVTAHDLRRLEIGDMSWLTDRSVGDMAGEVRGKDSETLSDT